MLTFDLARVSTSAGQLSLGSAAVSPATWYVAVGICALADADRHLGHAVRQGSDWLVYDAVHPNAAGDGFTLVGRFKSMVDAQLAIESSVGVHGRWWAEETQQTKPY